MSQRIFFWIFFSLIANCAGASPFLGAQQIAAGGYSTCAVIGGNVQCWGGDAIGEVVDQTGIHYFEYDSASPQRVPFPQLTGGVTMVAIGGTHFCAVVNGGVFCWGSDFLGDTGDGSLTSGASAIYLGAVNSCAVVNAGAQCWGDDDFGQLGNSSITAGYSRSPVMVETLDSGVTKMAVGTDDINDVHVCAIRNGGAFCWGSNSTGQMGGDTTPPFTSSDTPVAVTGLSTGVADIAAGYQHTCAVVNGGVKCWGSNCTGQLGSSAVGLGCSGYSQTPVSVDGLTTGAVAVTASYNHSCALVHSADPAHPVKCWGNNSSGQLGNNSTNSSPTPVDAVFFPPLASGESVTGIAAGAQHVCATIRNSQSAIRIECWGNNEAGQLGVAGGNVLTSIPISTVGVTGASGLSTGSSAEHVCVIVAGAAKCFGLNEFGELGDGFRVDRSIPLGVSGLGSGVSQIAAAFDLSCAVVNGGAMCWGDEYFGELGNNSQYFGSVTPVPVSGLSSGVTKIASGGGSALGGGGFQPSGVHACALVNGGVRCWGSNSFGQLGSSAVTVGVDMFDAEYFSAVPVAVDGLPAGSGATDVTAGGTTSCVVINHAAQCWGRNVGNSSFPSGSAAPVGVTGLTSGVTAITAGTSHACAITSGAVSCWGDNSTGQLGNSHFLSSASLDPISVDGLTSGVVAIAAASVHTCALLNGGVKCWGSRAGGRLGNSADCFGNGSFDTCNAPVDVTGLGAGSGVVAIGTSANSSCALLSSGQQKCWGDDFFGQLGDGRLLTVESPQVVVNGDEIFEDVFGG